MSMQFTCDDKSTLIAYLYGEIEPAARKAVDDHLATCAACSAEITALGDVRSELGLWVPPDVELDFAIVKKSSMPTATVLRPARWWSTVPVWAQAAAAVLVLAAGSAIANVQIKSGPEGFSVSTGWIQPTAAVTTAPVPATDESYKTALVALEQRLRDEIRVTREQQPTRVAAAAPADEATVRRVQQMISDAERRHERELAVRMVEFSRDMNMQRRADLMKISQGFEDYNGQLLRQRQRTDQLINNVALRVNGQQ